MVLLYQQHNTLSYLCDRQLLGFGLKQLLHLGRVQFNRLQFGPEGLLTEFMVLTLPVHGTHLVPEQTDGLLLLLEERRLATTQLRGGWRDRGHEWWGRGHHFAKHGRRRGAATRTLLTTNWS